jgi:hypothetical protein
MGAVIPWSRLLALIESHYPKAGYGTQLKIANPVTYATPDDHDGAALANELGPLYLIALRTILVRY